MLMPVLVSVVAALLTQGGGADAPRSAWVSAEELLVLAEPDAGAFVTGRLKRGDRVVVRRESPKGWFAIDPPADSFSWVPREAVEETQNGNARVMVRAVAVRPGSTSARMPGGNWTTLALGDRVRLLDRPPLVLRRVGETARVWLAVEPPSGELRYVRADGISPLDPRTLANGEGEGSQRFDLFASAPSAEAGRRSIQASRRVGPIDPAFASVGPPLPESGLTTRFADQVRGVESAHRSMLARSMETWHLEEIRAAYQALFDQSATPQERSAVQGRLGQVERQMRAAEAMRKAEVLLQKSRQVDADVLAVESRLQSLSTGAASYDAKGLFHHTSMLVSGQRIYVLFDERGHIAAYLRIPPGLDASSRLGHRVGVRGEAHYDESLRGRLIDVRDLVPLDQAP